MINFYQEEKLINQYINQSIIVYIEMFINFANNLEFDEIYEEVFPMHLRKNQEYCLEKIQQLNQYLLDEFLHEISPLNEYILYHILNFMDSALEDGEEQEYFQINIKQFLERNYKYLDNNKKLLINSLNNLQQIIGFVFEDIDFLDIGVIFQKFVKDPFNFEKRFNIDLDLYKELMPSDISKKYDLIKMSIENNVIAASKSYSNFDSEEEFIEFIKGIIEKFSYYTLHKKLYKIINRNEKIFNEKEFQILFGFYLEIYLKDFDLDISAETDTGRGNADFKISCGKKYRAIIEFKLDTNNNLDKGIDFQLPLYQYCTEIDYGIYAIIGFNDKSYENFNKYKEKALEASKKYKKQIDYFYIDVRNNKESASNIKSDKDMLIDEI